MASLAWAQFPQQVGPLIGAPITTNACQGVGVALSADGRTAIVGAPGDTGGGGVLGVECEGGAGAAFVYVHTLGGWLQQAKLVGTGTTSPANQGYSVALSADGNTAAIGGPTDNGSVGAVWFFTRAAGVWTQQAKVVGTGNVGASLQGRSVSLSADGNTAVVGGPGDNPILVGPLLVGTGATWIFTRTGGVWSQTGSKLIGTGAVGPAFQGSSTSISGDGNTVIVGGPFDNTNIGAAWVFTQTSPGVWSQQGGKIVPPAVLPPTYFGISSSVSSNGNDAIVGGFGDTGGLGASWVYTRLGAVWSLQQKLTGTGFSGVPAQGSSVSISADGNMAAVGGNRDNGENGAVWVYTRSGTTWTQLGTKLVGTGSSAPPVRQGTSVALAADKLTLIEGGYFNGSVVGAAWIFGTSTGALVATTTTLSASPNPAPQGQGVALTATVTNAGGVPGTPVGFVTFFDGAFLLGTAPPINASGQATLNVFGLSVGTHSITAVYGGDSTFSSSTSSPVTLVVLPSQTINITAHSPASAPFGSSFTVAATATSGLPVSIAASGSCSGSGSGSATITITSPTGTCTVTYSQAGNATFAAAPTLTDTTTATKANTTLSTLTSTGTLVVGQTITLSTTLSVVAPGAGTPTGTISFFNGATPIGTANVTSGAGAYSINYTLTSTTGSITAVYSGDANFNGSTSPAFDLSNVGKAPTTTTVTSSLNPSLPGQAVTFTAVVTSATAGTPTGTVTFFDGATSLATVALNASGQATFTSSALSAGPHSITAVYSSDATFAASTSAALSQVVKAATTLSTPVGAGTLVVGQTITISTTLAIVAPGVGTPTGTITFTNGSTTIGTVTVTGAGAYSINYTLVSTTGSIVATYSGDANFQGATSAAFNLANVKVPTTTTLTGPSSAQLNQTLTFTATVSVPAGSGVTPGGTVAFTLNSSPVAGCQTVSLSSGVASCNILFSASGTQSVGATYSGDANTAGSTASLQVTVGAAQAPASLVLTISSSAPGPTVAQPITFTATLTGPGTPQGTVQIFDGTTLLGTGVVRNGQAFISVPSLSAGSHNLLAVFNNIDGPNISTVFGQYVYALPTRLVLSVSPSPSVFGQTVTLSAQISFSTPPEGISAPSGTVRFFDGATLLGTVTVVAGVAVFQISELAAGTHQFTATYSGDSSWNVSVSIIVVHTVGLAATTTVPSAVPDFSGAAPQVTLTAKVTAVAPGAGVPAGTVQFVDVASGSLLATATLDAGTATSKIPLTLTGARTIQATFAGNANYQGSTGTAPLIQLVNAASFASTTVTGNEIVTIFGSSLADSTAPATSLPLPEKLGGSTVTVKDSAGVERPAQWFYVSPNQVNFLIPPNPGTAPVTISITNSAGRTFSIITQVAAVVPGLFSAEATGRGVAAAQVVRVAADGTQTISNVANISSGGGVQPVPIDLSDTNFKFYVQLYGTGLRAGRNVTATINGISMPVLYSGAQPSFVGLDQINLGPLPVSLRGSAAVDVQITVDGQPANTVTLTFQ